MNPQLKLSRKKKKKKKKNKSFETALSLVYCIPLLYFRYCSQRVFVEVGHLHK